MNDQHIHAEEAQYEMKTRPVFDAQLSWPGLSLPLLLQVRDLRISLPRLTQDISKISTKTMMMMMMDLESLEFSKLSSTSSLLLVYGIPHMVRWQVTPTFKLYTTLIAMMRNLLRVQILIDNLKWPGNPFQCWGYFHPKHKNANILITR